MKDLTRKLIVLDTSTTEIHIYEVSSFVAKDSERIENWIFEKTKHKLSQISWMVLPHVYQIQIH